MPFIAIDENHFVNTKNIDYVGQDSIDGQTVVFIKSGGDRLLVKRGFEGTVFNVVRNQDKEEGNWVGR
jgi:hypothetical protein